MQIIISGYGRMGKEVEAIARKRGHDVLLTLDRKEDWDQLSSFASSKPVVIDFSQPAVVADNILLCFKHHLPVVVGTTGWNNQLPELKARCVEEGQSLFMASNFSIGVNLFFALNRYLAGLMEEQPAYDVSIRETHHIHKLDKPSGTAISLAEQVLEGLKRKSKWVPGDSPGAGELGIESIREGEIYGDHMVRYDSVYDSLEIRHSAKTREGFARGAVLAAEWLADKTGFFGMNDLLQI